MEKAIKQRVIGFFQNGKISHIFYLKNGFEHNENGPATITFDFEGNKLFESYYINGIRHREDGPSIICYCSGNILSEEYYIRGIRHREDGPSFIIYYSDFKKYSYYVNGVIFSNECYLQALKEYKLEEMYK